jgi:hypothetical protein
MNSLSSVSALAMLIATALPAFAEDAKTKPCEPQPTCEFGDLVIKPGAPTPGLKPQDSFKSGGIDIQSRQSSDLRNSYRLPEDPTAGVRLAK